MYCYIQSILAWKNETFRYVKRPVKNGRLTLLFGQRGHHQRKTIYLVSLPGNRIIQINFYKRK